MEKLSQISEKDFFENIGLSFSFVKDRLSGTIYHSVDDFIVEEIQKDSICTIQKESTKHSFDNKYKFIHATLVKKNLSTFEACNIFAQKNGLNYTDIKVCGLKDTNGVTAQKICFNNTQLVQTEFENFFLKDFSPSNENIDINSHRGNKFTIRIRNIKQEPRNIYLIKEFSEKIEKGLPNFYGPQRFGIRQNNHNLGRLLLKEEYEKFLFEFLTHSKNEPETIVKIRTGLKDNFGNWEKCFSLVKKNPLLIDEAEVLDNIKKNNNYLESIEKMKLSGFFAHAYSSYIFNLALSKYLSKNWENCEMEKIGSTTELSNSNKDLFEPILTNDKMSIEDFKHPIETFRVKNHPRQALFFPRNFKYKFEGNDLIVMFELGNGEYASLVLGFLVENAFWKLN